MLKREGEAPEVDRGQTSILAQGCKFEGKIDVRGTFRVEGEFRGSIATPENLVVGKTGVVHAECQVKNAVIGGQVFGNIVAEHKIELQSGSRLEGNIKTKRLVIDEGVVFEGNCSMGGERHGLTPAGPAVPGAPGAASPAGIFNPQRS